MNRPAARWPAAIAMMILAGPAFGQATRATDKRVADCASAQQFDLDGSIIRVTVNPGDYSLGFESICRWTVHAADIVTTYFGNFPVNELQLVFEPAPGQGVQGGTTYGDGSASGGPLTTIRLGREATEADLDGDWVMVHEMTHLAIPSVPRRSHWLEEGIATYIEPIARARRGELSAKRVWTDMLEGMPKGLPKEGDHGLDRTHSWGRTYWGGALFCLLADVEIRRQTTNRSSLDDALRGVLNAGGNITRDWKVIDVLKAGDRATGTHVLAELYGRMAQEPGMSDLSDFWKRLGIIPTANGVRFVNADDSSIRDAITASSTPIP